MYRLRSETFTVVDYLDYDRAENKFQNRIIEKSELPKDELFLPDRIELSYSHLEALNLATWPLGRSNGKIQYMLSRADRKRGCDVIAR